MTMYTPRHFDSNNRDDALALIRAWPFATLITAADSEPRITHLPLLLEGEHLTGHMARANPHWQAFAAGHTVAVFHGPHAYISPSWYVVPEREVPTWNYATVHVQGTPLLIDDAVAKLAIVDAATAAFENPANPWQRKVEGARLEAMLNSIVAFHIPLTTLEAKFKMNQNKAPQDRAQVITQLRASAHPDLAAMADWMSAHE